MRHLKKFFVDNCFTNTKNDVGISMYVGKNDKDDVNFTQDLELRHYNGCKITIDHKETN